MARIDWRREYMNDWRSRMDTSHIEDTYINLSKNKVKKYGSHYPRAKSVKQVQTAAIMLKNNFFF